MAYVTGNIIRKGDYNIFATGSEDGTLSAGVPSAGLMWGTGFGPYGYGQNNEYIAPVVAGDVIRKDEWNNLDSILLSIRNHQEGPGTYTGQSPLDSGYMIAPRPLYAPTIQQAFNNVGKSYSKTDEAASVSMYNGRWGYPISTKLMLNHTVRFPSGDAARYFFNAGGTLKLNFSNTTNIQTPRTMFWSDLCQAAGTVEIGYRNTIKINTDTGGYYGYYASQAFVLDQNNGGYWGNQNAGGALVKHFQQDSAGYGYYGYYGGYGGYGGYYGNNGLDYLRVDLSITENDSNNGNLGASVNIFTTFNNGSASALLGDYNDIMSSNVKSNLVISRPTKAFLETASWLGYQVTTSQVLD